MTQEPFTLDGDYTGDLPPEPKKPKAEAQGWLFLPHVDVRAGKKDRYATPTLMDYLSDMGAV